MISNLKEVNVTIKGKFELAGTMVIPEDGERKYPAVLIIPGTGPGDRDGNSKLLRMNLYKELAHQISKWGIITLRYDKRGINKSKGSYLETGFWDLVEDAGACVNYLKSHPNVDPERIIVLGHSEGCLIAPALNARQPVQGLILLAGMGAPTKEILPKQNEMLVQELEEMQGFKGLLIRLFKIPQRIRKQSEKALAKILQSTTPTIRIQGKKINAKWLREHYEYNVLDDLAQVTCPTLAITGSKDLQVDPQHAEIIANTVKGEAEWYILSNMTHILKKTEEPISMLTLIKTYNKLANAPIDQDLVEKIDNWLQKYYL
jgi:esterase/lipase